MVLAWSPGIGDPSIGGWLTVGLYGLAAWSTYLVRERLRDAGAPADERMLWTIFSIGLICLGVNKQLDLQTALTEIGRWLAHTGGWYESRRAVQFGFIAVTGLVSLAAFAVLVRHALRLSPATRVATFGVIFVLTFVAIRAASFHHVDQLIGSTLAGLRWNWILEMGGLGVIILGSTLRRREIVSLRADSA